MLARRAAGSMRDSQSLFEQLLASADKRITAAEVHRLLGTASDERLIELFASIIGRQRQQTLALFSQALLEGAQLGEFADQILSYLRDLMVLAAEATNVPLLSVSETNSSVLLKQAQSWGLNTIVAALQIVSEAKLKMQRATFGRAGRTRAHPVDTARTTAIARCPADRIGCLADWPNASGGRSSGWRTGKKKPEPVTPEPAEELRGMGIPARPEPESVDSRSPLTVEEPASEGTGRSAHPPNEPVAESDRSLTETEDPAVLDVVSPSSSTDFLPGSESDFSAQVLSEVGDDVGNALRKAGSVAICGPNRLEVEFPKSYLFAKSLAEKPDARQKLDSVVTRLAGRPVQVVFGISDEPAQNGNSIQAPKPNRRMDTSTDGDPYVEKAIELFNAKVMKKESLVLPSGQET